MAEIAQLETELLAAVEKASDEAALEAVRVSALGKSGSVSALLKTLSESHMAVAQARLGPEYMHKDSRKEDRREEMLH